MPLEKNFRRTEPFLEQSPKPTPAHLGIGTVESKNGTLGIEILRRADFCGNFQPVTHRRHFAKGNPRLHHAERPWIHAEKNDALFAAAEFAQILFMRRPRVIQRIIDVRDRRLESQAIHHRAQFARCGDELFAFCRHAVRYSLEWLPSQKQGLLVCLQPHHATVLASVISVFTGAKPVHLCEPSQNGWLFDLPHAHQ